jgi:hypothetical protein
MAEPKRIYRIHSLNLTEINRVFAQMMDRIDELEGFRGEAKIRDNFNVMADDDTDTVLHSLRGTG